jgi:hypothetical protein
MFLSQDGAGVISVTRRVVDGLMVEVSWPTGGDGESRPTGDDGASWPPGGDGELLEVSWPTGGEDELLETGTEEVVVLSDADAVAGLLSGSGRSRLFRSSVDADIHSP